MNGEAGGDFVERLAATDRLYGDPCLELGTTRAALSHGWEPPFKGGDSPQRLGKGAVQKKKYRPARPLEVRTISAACTGLVRALPTQPLMAQLLRTPA